VNKLLEFTKSELTKQPNKFLVLIRDKGNEVNRDKIRSAISIIIPDIVKNGKLQNVIYSMYDIVILITHQITLTKVYLCIYIFFNNLKKIFYYNSIFYFYL